MRSFSGVRRWFVGAVAVSSVGCGIVPVKVPLPSVGQKDFTADAQKAMQNLQSEYTLAKGVVALVQTKVDEFLYIEDGLKLGKVQWKEFRNELEACWNTPFEAVTGGESRLVNASEAAQAFRGNSALHEVQAVKDTGWNAVNKVKACPQALKDDVKGFPKKTTDEAKAWARQKFEVLNELRVLAKDEVAKRATALKPAAEDAVKVLATQIAAANGHLALAKQAGDSAVAAATQTQVDQLSGMQAEAQKLLEQATTDSVALGKSASEAAVKVQHGFLDVYGKRK